MKKLLKINFTLLIFLIILIFTSNSFSQDNDKEKLLAGIEFNVSYVKYEKDSISSFFDVMIPVKIYSIRVKIRYQTVCMFGIDNKSDSAYAYFDFIVGHDSDYAIHDKFVREIYEFWKSKDSSYIVDYKGFSSEYGIYYQQGDYILYNYLVQRHIPYILWFDKRIIRIDFSHLEEEKAEGTGASQLFEFIKFHFMYRNELKIDEFNYFPPYDFITLYEGGKFNKRRPIDEFYEEHK